MTAELWQFGIMVAVFCAALVLWLGIVYLPRRTMERWEGPEPEPRDASPGAVAEKIPVSRSSEEPLIRWFAREAHDDCGPGSSGNTGP